MRQAGAGARTAHVRRASRSIIAALPGGRAAAAIMATVPERSIVNLPPGVRAPFDVYVNGVHQAPGVDFEILGSSLVFGRELKKEGKLGFWRWFLGAWGVGTYRQNDSVDVRYERDGHPILLEGLDIEPECPPP
jgi:hypothetical protein